MLKTTVFAEKSLLLLLIISINVRLAGQTVPVQQKVVFTDYNKPYSEVPVKKVYDEDAKSWYAVYNKENTVHVYLAITDPQQQRKIVMNGVELWIDTKGKKNKKTGILFPYIEVKNQPMPPMQGQGPRPNFFNNNERPDSIRTQELEAAIAKHHEMKLTGFKEELNGVQNSNHPSGIHASMYFEKDTLVYEAQLPLNTLPEAVPLNSHIAIGIIEKGMGVPGINDGGMPPPDGGGGGGDGMMPPPGGGGPPPGGPGGEDGMRIFEDNIIWYKFSLQQETAVF